LKGAHDFWKKPVDEASITISRDLIKRIIPSTGGKFLLLGSEHITRLIAG
jgi:hypothetical protein